MATKIQWTQETWNPTAGCRIYSPGCSGCYAMQMAARLEVMGQAKYAGLTRRVNGKAVWTGEVRPWEPDLLRPLAVKRPTRWFVDSMSDLFFGDERDGEACERAGVPFASVPEAFLDQVFAVMALCPQHTFQVLTKRPGRMAEYLANPDCRRRIWNARCDLGKPIPPMPWPLPNVWLGTSVERQQEADERIPLLLQTPAAVRFLSCEPLLGALDLSPWLWEVYRDADGHRCDEPRSALGWLIVGTESGPARRPLKLPWAESLVEQGRAAGVPVFVKQLPVGGRVSHELAEWPEGLRVREFPGETR